MTIPVPELKIKSFIDSTFNTSSQFLFYLNQLDIDASTYTQVSQYNSNTKASVLLNYPFIYANPSAAYIVINLEENFLEDQVIGNKVEEGSYTVGGPITFSQMVDYGSTAYISGIIDNNNISISPVYSYTYSYDQVNNTSSLYFNDQSITTSTQLSITYNPITYTPSVYAAIFRYAFKIYIGTQNELTATVYAYIMKELFYTQILYYLNSLGAYNTEFNFEPFLADEQELPVNLWMRQCRLSFSILDNFSLPSQIDVFDTDNPMFDPNVPITSISSQITSTVY